jgi:mannose-6-phosphate isomerase-like protein (cupin superfamily)
MAEPYTLKNLAEVGDAASAHGLDGFWEARVAGRSLEAERTGVAFFRLKAGRRSAFAHRHEEAEEIYVVLRGRGRMKLDDQIVEVSPLDAVRVAPHVVRAFEAGGDGLDFLVFGAHHAGDGELVEDGWAGGSSR